MITKAIPKKYVPLSILQSDSLLAMIHSAGGSLPLHKTAMRQLRRKGLNRSDIDGAIKRLVELGRISAAASDNGVVLRLTGASNSAQQPQMQHEPS